MTPTLLTIPFSHYCEKARWALDHAGVAYAEQGHVPGLHRIAVRRARSRATSVPVLVTGDAAIGDSTDIVAWADGHARDGRRLYLDDAKLQAEVAAIEHQLDEELGPHLRRVLYFHLLPRPALVFALADQATPAWERATVRAIFPVLRAGMRRFMNIRPSTAERSLGVLRRVLDAMEARLADGRPYLVGDRFTAADLTLAALSAPAIQPPEHPVRFPTAAGLPEGVASLLAETQARPVAAFVRRMYRAHRGGVKLAPQ